MKKKHTTLKQETHAQAHTPEDHNKWRHSESLGSELTGISPRSAPSAKWEPTGENTQIEESNTHTHTDIHHRESASSVTTRAHWRMTGGRYMCVCVSMNRLTPLVKSRRCYEKESKAPSSETVKQLWKAGTQKKYLFFYSLLLVLLYFTFNSTYLESRFRERTPALCYRMISEHKQNC